VEIYAESTPAPPTLTALTTYQTTMPQFTWTYPSGYTPLGYEVLLGYQPGDTTKPGWPSKTGAINQAQTGTATSLIVPQGFFWGSGDYRFTVQVVVFDNYWCPDPSAVQNFSIAGIEAPAVSELAAPAGTYTLPFSITQGMVKSQLPVTKAGGKIGVTVNTIGPASMLLTATAAYGPNGTGNSATVGTQPTTNFTGSQTVDSYNEQWQMECYTSADIGKVPTGTLVTAQFKDTVSGATLFLTPSTGSNSDTEDVYWPAYPTFANGAVTTKGSVYSKWFVVLQGRALN
jgi:hypothetical protein